MVDRRCMDQNIKDLIESVQFIRERMATKAVTDFPAPDLGWTCPLFSNVLY